MWVSRADETRIRMVSRDDGCRLFRGPIVMSFLLIGACCVFSPSGDVLLLKCQVCGERGFSICFGNVLFFLFIERIPPHLPLLDEDPVILP